MATNPTPAELEARLDEHPELIERLKAGDTSAFEDILEQIGGAKIGEVTVRLKKSPVQSPVD